MDATYFAKFCLVAYQDDLDGYTQLISFTDGEHYEDIKEDLNNLLLLGVRLESITSDRDKSILKAIKKTDKNIIIQRCLVHIQIMCLIWLTKFPKHIAGQELRKHVLLMLKIKTHNDRIWWTQELKEWYEGHKDYLNDKTINTETEAVLVHPQTIEKIILYHKKGAPKYVLLFGQSKHSKNNQRNRRVLQSFEKPLGTTQRFNPEKQN